MEALVAQANSILSAPLTLGLCPRYLHVLLPHPRIYHLTASVFCLFVQKPTNERTHGLCTATLKRATWIPYAVATPRIVFRASKYVAFPICGKELDEITLHLKVLASG